MKKILLILVIILAGYFVVSNSKKEEGVSNDQNAVQETTAVWKWRSDGYVFTLPVGWKASSSDGGTISLLTVEPSEGEGSDSAGIIYHRGECTDFTSTASGTSPSNCITQEDFEKSSGTIISIEEVTFLGEKAKKQIVDSGGQKFEKYYIEGLNFVSFSIPIGHRYETEIRKMVNSIKINPTKAELESARMTP